MGCYHTITVLNKKGQYVSAPCGKCPYCFERRVDSWAFRLSEENRVSSSCYILTLTYANPPLTKNGYMTLCRRDFQLFMKRLRKLSGNRLKYYMVGEYGSKYMRPHYHVILFNLEDVTLVEECWSNFSSNFGFVHVDHKFSTNAVNYCAKYFAKEKRIPMHSRDDREKEFSLMSKKLGLSYLEKNRNFHERSQKFCVYLPGGYIKPLPKYFRDKIFTDEEKEHHKNMYAHDNDTVVDVEKIEFAKKLYFKKTSKLKENDI